MGDQARGATDRRVPAEGVRLRGGALRRWPRFDRAAAPQAACRAGEVAPTTGLRRVPSCGERIRTSSPERRKLGGARDNPTPAGVPVRITSDGLSWDAAE